jgi:hypothetical protein
MPENRAARRRKEREGGGAPFYRRPEVLTGAIIAAMGIATFIIVIVLLSGGGDGDDGDTVGEPTATSEPVIFVPETADDVAIDQLARRTVEALPSGEWPALYTSFTQEYRDRCPEDEFIQAGVDSSEQLGQSLQTIEYVRLQDVQYLDDTNVRLVIVGRVPQGEYTLEALFQKVDDAWKIAPAPSTTGCNAFSRLSDPPTSAP